MTLFVFLLAVINSLSKPNLLEIHLCISTAFNQEEGQSNTGVYSGEIQETSCQHIVSHRFQLLRFGAGFFSFQIQAHFSHPMVAAAVIIHLATDGTAYVDQTQCNITVQLVDTKEGIHSLGEP